MPENPEIKLCAELIKPLVLNKLVANATVGHSSRYKNNPPEGYNDFISSFRNLTDIGYMVSSLRIKSIKTKGKFMYWTFDNGYYMFSTFGMSGQWSPKEGKHVSFQFSLLSEDTTDINRYYLYFNDPRHFGSIKFTNNKQELLNKLNELGWDALQDNLDNYFNFLVNKVTTSSKPIGQLLMDQSIFAGVGNYIRAEALYQIKMSPWRLGNSMSKEEVLALCQSIISVMKESYSYQGATILTYKTAFGEEGKYSSCFKVYGLKKDSFGNKIIKEETPEGRTIHWCPAIQK